MNGIEESKILDQREEIRKFVESKGHEIVDTFFMEEAPEDVKTPGIYYLARAFMKGLCYADAIVLAPGWENARGCLIEREAAYSYGLKVYEYIGNHLMLYPKKYVVDVTVKPNAEGEL
jgi:hypothetical protein